MIRKMSGKNQSTPLKHLIKDNTQVTNIKDIADTLAETSANSSSTNSYIVFHKYKDKKDKNSILNRTTLKSTTKSFHYQN